MIEFKPFDLSQKKEYEAFLRGTDERGCEYSFANLYLWGRQRAAIMDGYLVFFSQFARRSVYPFPVGGGDVKPVLDAIIQDSRRRGIPCRITGLTQGDRETLEALYPGKFRIHCDRDGFDYVYAIDDLADLKGKKFQKKRNHVNKFRQMHPDYTVEPLTEQTLPAARQMIEDWYEDRMRQDPHGDFCMEQVAIRKALENFRALELEGMVLLDEGKVLAVTLGSRMGEDTFDIHFEKAWAHVDGAYAAINQEFARYLREKYPQVKFLNREDDMGLEGLRKAKLSYNPHHLVEKSWACLLEDGCEY